MNKPLTIADAITGKGRPVEQKRWQFTCPSCGRDNGMSGYPFPIKCNSFNCWTEIEPEENPFFVRPSMLTLQVPE